MSGRHASFWTEQLERQQSRRGVVTGLRGGLLGALVSLFNRHPVEAHSQPVPTSAVPANDRLRILIAIEPPGERETLARILRGLGPRLLVHPVEPAELAPVVKRLRPALVICDRLSPVLQGYADTWLLIHPRGAAPPILGTGPHGRELPSSGLSEVIGAIETVLDEHASPR